MDSFNKELIYELEKDNPYNNSKEFRTKITKKYGTIDNLTNLYAKIRNYQIDKYGKTLNRKWAKRTYNDLLKWAQDARKRKYNRTKEK